MNKKYFPAAFGLLILIVITFTFLLKDYTLDDALIYYRYIKNALEGNGLVYNVGEKFNGLTSPLFTYISLAVNFFTESIPHTQLAMSGAFLAGTAVLLVILLIRNGLEPVWAFGAGLLLVGNRFIYITFGMETTMMFFFAVLTLVLFFRHSYFWMGITSTAMFLTRGETLFLITTLMIFHFVMKRKFPDWKIFIAPLMMLAGNYLFNYFYYGSFLPNTMSAKIHQGDSGLWRSWPFLRFRHLLFDPTGRFFPEKIEEIIFVMFVATGIYGLAANFAKSRLLQVLFVFAIKYTAFYVILNVPSYKWYYAIYFLMGSIFVVYGLRSLAGKIPGKKAGLSIAAIIYSVFVISFFYASASLIPKDDGNKDYTEIGIWLKENTPANSSVACVEIGHIGWYSERYIIDILGLVNPYNAELIGKRDMDGFFNYYTPDFIFVHFPLWNHEVGVETVINTGAYKYVETFNFNGYKLLEKNEEFRIDK